MKRTGMKPRSEPMARTVPMPRASRLQVVSGAGAPELATVTAIGSGGRVLPLAQRYNLF